MATIAVAFVLFGLMEGFVLGFESMVEEMPADRLSIQNRTLSQGVDGLPYAMTQQIKQVEGVATVTYFHFLSAYYKDPQQSTGTIAIDPETFFQVWPEYFTTPETIQALKDTRVGLIAGRHLAEEHDWKVGDQIPLISEGMPMSDGSTTWVFEVVGFWDTEQGFEARQLIIRYDYLNETRTTSKDRVAGIHVLVDDHDRAGEITKEIDDYYINSGTPTRTMSQREMLRTQLTRIGDVSFFVNAIVGSALFTILFVTGGTLMQSIRERIPEFAVLRSFGYPMTVLAGLAVCESVLICVVGALIGLGIAFGTSSFAFQLLQFMTISLPWTLVGYGLVVAVTMGVAGAVLPVIRLARSSVVDALAGR